MVRRVPVRIKSAPAAAGSTRGEAAPPASEIPSVDRASFDALLRRTIGLSLREQKETRSHEELASWLHELQPEARSKLRVVMAAGRDRSSLASAHASVSASAQGALAASELESAGDKLGDYLARGYAIACATQFPLDTALERWSASERGELEERVWLRFGRQLASSTPEEWECLGAIGASGEGLAQLYLRLGEAVWWSFGAVLDRPSREMVRKEGRSRSTRHSKLGRLRNVAERRCDPKRRALRRALRAIRARIGTPLEA